MPRKNRGYKKGEAYKDARLVVIACEGIREKIYFEHLIGQSQRIKLEILAPEGEEKGRSHPKQVYNRAERFSDEYGLNGKDDSLWLVMDVDRWKRHILHEIIKEVGKKDKWNISISNPCFEVWLYYHLEEVEPLTAAECKEIKQFIHQSVDGGYKVEIFTEKAFEAVQKAKNADTDLENDFPNLHVSKVYQLVEYLENNLK